MSSEDLHGMALGDFLLHVESKLLIEEDRLERMADHIIPHLGIYTGSLMQSSGNMKKTFEPLEFAKETYPSESVWGTDKKAGKSNKDYDEERAKLEQRFNLPKKDD